MHNQQIRGSTRLIALLGHPVAHSLSPQIHNHALAAARLPYAYVPLDVPPHHLEAAIGFLRACGFLGANVTIPHKQQALRLCDEVSELSRTIGAVNTLIFRDNRLHGTTTDGAGFLRALGHMDARPHGAHAVILGNGGAARTIAFTLAMDPLTRPSRLTLVGRDKNKVAPLAAEVAAKTGAAVADTLFSSPALADTMARCTLCINCTSIGMHPNVDSSPLPEGLLHPAMTVFDTVYNPSQTLLLKQARAAGCRTQNGLRMLLCQGLESLRLWTGVAVSEELFDMQELEKAAG